MLRRLDSQSHGFTFEETILVLLRTFERNAAVFTIFLSHATSTDAPSTL